MTVRWWALAATLALTAPFLAFLFLFDRPEPVPPAPPSRPDTVFARERHGWLEAYGEDAQWLAFADALHRQGLDRDALAAMKAHVETAPDSSALWAGYANAITVAAGGRMDDDARAAWYKAIALAPAKPGPRYLYGRALIAAGRPGEGLEVWRALLETVPQDARWADVVREKIALVERRAAERSGSATPNRPRPAT